MNIYESIKENLTEAPKRKALGRGIDDLVNNETNTEALNSLFNIKGDINDDYDVEYFNKKFYEIRKELEGLKEEAKSQDLDDIVYGIDKILETWDNDAIIN